VIVHVFALSVPMVVAPLGARLLGRRTDAITFFAASLVAAPTFAFHRGAAAACWVLPWLALAALSAVSDIRRSLFSFWGRFSPPEGGVLHRVRRGGVLVDRQAVQSDVATAAASAFLAVAAGSLLLSRLGFTFGRLHEPIVELTAVHYGVAGYAATLLASCAADAARPRHHGVGLVALVATISSPPIVALGFLTGNALAQVGGAVLLTVGVWSTALLTVLDARPRSADRTTRLLLAACAAAPVAPMILAVTWAAAQHWAVPALDIPAMARIHGSMNAIGFVGCGLVGYQRLRAAAPLAAAAPCS
jgi:hypothetical protein